MVTRCVWALVSELLIGMGLRKCFGSVVAVDDVHIVVRPGEVVGLLGPNGAGKSTTFQLLAGRLRPDGGRVVLCGEDVTSWTLARRARSGLGYLPQHASVLPRMSVLQNVRIAAASPAAAREQLDAVGLVHLETRTAGTLSGGERRRLEIARCLALQPQVLLLDEPYAGLDPANVGDLRERIRGLAARGIGVLLTDHAVRDALRTCDQATIIDGGIVQVSGTPSEVASSERVRARYLGHDFCV